MAFIVFVLGILPASLLCVSACMFNIVTAYFIPEISVFASFFDTLAVLLPGFVCGLMISKKAKALDIIIGVTICVVIFPLIALGYEKYALGFNLSQSIVDFFDQVFFEQFKLIKSLYPELSNTFSGSEYDVFSFLAVFIPGLIPAISIVIAMFYSAVIFMISKSLLKRKMIENSFFIQGLDCIYIPRINTTVLFILILFLFLETSTFFMMAILNIFVVLFAFFMIQGLSVIEYKLKQKNLKAFIRFVSLIGIIIALSVISSIIPILNPIFALSILGISDSTNDYRKINSNKDDMNEI